MNIDIQNIEYFQRAQAEDRPIPLPGGIARDLNSLGGGISPIRFIAYRMSGT